MSIRAAIFGAIAALPGLMPGLAAADGWALGGMDVVAYRSAGQAVEGETGISTRWAGQEWHFASEANRALFEADPRAYAPAFKGLCPIALAQGRVIEGNPRDYAIVGGQLFLFESEVARRQFLLDPKRWADAAASGAKPIAK